MNPVWHCVWCAVDPRTLRERARAGSIDWIRERIGPALCGTNQEVSNKIKTDRSVTEVWAANWWVDDGH